ncbi:hypothetical protein ACPCHV_05090 [Microbacterium sp. NPDC088796]
MSFPFPVRLSSPAAPRRRHRLLAGALGVAVALSGVLIAAPASAAVAAASPSARPAAASAGPLLSDPMNRTVASGWGASPVGAWRVIEGASSVGNGQAMLASRKPGITARATVAGVTAADVSSRYTVTVPALPVGGPLYLAQAVRIVGKDSYGVRLRVHPDGSAYVSVSG